MSASTQTDQDLSRREEMSVSTAAMSAAPWGAATVTGGVVAVGDLGLHVIAGHIGLNALSGSVAMGAVAFFVVAAAGALWRARPSRAIRWARSNPWRFAVLPALACAAVALVLSVVTGGGIIAPVLSGASRGSKSLSWLSSGGGERDALIQAGERHLAEDAVHDLVPGVEEEGLRQRVDTVCRRHGEVRVKPNGIADAVGVGE